MWYFIMAKFKPRYYKSDQINFTNHWAIGTEWEYPGSKDMIYTTKFTENGFTCDCYGMQFHGKCKHAYGLTKEFTQ